MHVSGYPSKRTGMSPSDNQNQLDPTLAGTEDLVAQLQRLGFAEPDARRALSATQDSSSNGTPSDAEAASWQYGAHTTPWGQRAIASALDWLCVHLPEAALPAKYAAGEDMLLQGF